MDVLLGELVDGPGGVAVHRDTALATKVVAIGCAADQQIQLLGRTVGAQHAVIRGTGARLSLACLGRFRALVNGKPVSSSRSTLIALGDRIEIGGHELTIVQAPTGFDLAIELRRNPRIDNADFEAAFTTDLQATWLGKRRTVWALVLLTGLVGLVIPVAVLRWRRAGRPVPAWVPADALWSTGPLAPGHRQVIGDRCESCHQTLFTRVPDQACAACHKGTLDHVVAARLALTSLGPTQACAACHHEHDEPSQLVDRADKLCVDCHAGSAKSFGSLAVHPVVGFGTDRHPAFGANLAVSAGLKFSHREHLRDDPAHRRKDGALPGCGDCHKLAADGEHFELPTMANSCASCHELTFDKDAPDRQLPHGKPRDVVRTLQDYFVRKQSQPSPVQPATVERRRLPGQSEPMRACTGSTFKCAMQAATAEVEEQFLRRGCVTCHQINDTNQPDLVDRFEVVPIQLARDFFPKARFPHQDHLVQGTARGDAACVNCHPTDSGKRTGDVTLPELPTCETCHADKPTQGRTTLQCVNCHGYHRRS